MADSETAGEAGEKDFERHDIVDAPPAGVRAPAIYGGDMLRALDRKLLREMRRLKGQVATIALVLAGCWVVAPTTT